MAKDVIPIETIRNMESGDLVSLIIGGDAEIKVDFPDGASLADVEQTLKLAITGYQRLHGAAEKLKPIIGRILLTVKQKKLWKGYHKNFTAFVQSKVVEQLGLSRANAFDSLKIATAFPGLTTTEYAMYGASKLLLATKVTNMAKPDWRNVLKSSQELTVDQFRATVDAMKKDLPQRPRPHVVAVRCDEETFNLWKAFTEGVDDVAKRFHEMLDVWATTNRELRRPAVTVGGKKHKGARVAHQNQAMAG